MSAHDVVELTSASESALALRQPLRQPSADGEDPVLATLDHARALYLSARAGWDDHEAELRQMRGEVARLQKEVRRLEGETQQAREDLTRERGRTLRQKERAEHLALALKEIHRALFDGNVFSLILKACATITGATRGIYLTTWGEGNLRPRAAVGIDDYPRAEPSAFLRALCARARDGQTFVANKPADFADLPAPERSDERFRNCMVAPVVLLKHFNAIIVLADKAEGDFDADDVDMVLHVGDQAAVAVENKHLQDELLQAYFDLVGVLADAVEAKDSYTHGHCEMVARYGRLTAARLGLSEELLSVVCYGGLLHDVGKIGVSDGVLHKPGKLMPEEWELMRSHVRIGRDLVARVPLLERVADVVLHHHERYDGAGYPEGLVGDNISIAARIICVVDAYCAMVTKRCYKDSCDPTQARAELLRCKGTQFDPAVVDAFLAVLDDPNIVDECPDGCGLPPQFHHPMELRRALLKGERTK